VCVNSSNNWENQNDNGTIVVDGQGGSGLGGLHGRTDYTPEESSSINAQQSQSFHWPTGKRAAVT